MRGFMIKAHFASTKDSDMRYAIKTRVSDPVFYLQVHDKLYVFLDSREIDVFREENRNPFLRAVPVNPFVQEVKKSSDNARFNHKLVFCLLSRYDVISEPITVPRTFPLDLADYLREKGVNLRVENTLFPERAQKTSEEVKYIQSALERTQKAFQIIENILAESNIIGDSILFEGKPLTVERVKLIVDGVLLEHSLFSVEGMIMSSGKHTAIPHHEGCGAIRPHVPLIVDLFPQDRLTGYFADMTRTYVKGKPTDAFKKMYNTVIEAQEKALSAVVPGAVVKEIHKQVSDTFIEHGYHVGDSGFIHGTGHGLGLDLHEEPSLSHAGDGILEIGNVITVEPGLYYAEHGGVRVEDVIEVTETGYKNLTSYPKDNYIIP